MLSYTTQKIRNNQTILNPNIPNTAKYAASLNVLLTDGRPVVIAAELDMSKLSSVPFNEILELGCFSSSTGNV